MFVPLPALFGVGCLLWLVGAAAIRTWGAVWLPDAVGGWIGIYVASFAVALVGSAFAWRRSPATADAKRSAAAVLILPTLFLDSWSSLFFSTIFPDLDATAAGPFGGWILISCAGVIVGASLGRTR